MGLRELRRVLELVEPRRSSRPARRLRRCSAEFRRLRPTTRRCALAARPLPSVGRRPPALTFAPWALRPAAPPPQLASDKATLTAANSKLLAQFHSMFQYGQAVQSGLAFQGLAVNATA